MSWCGTLGLIYCTFYRGLLLNFLNLGCGIITEKAQSFNNMKKFEFTQWLEKRENGEGRSRGGNENK